MINFTKLTTITDEELASLSLGAAEVLRRNGWCQGSIHSNRNGPGVRDKVCAIGALARANGVDRLSDLEIQTGGYTALGSRILDAAGLKCMRLTGIVAYNDLHASSVEDMILLFEQAAANLKGSAERMNDG